MKQIESSLIYPLLFLLLFTFHQPNLLAQEKKEQSYIEHSPVLSFIHGEKIEIKAQVGEDVEWIRFFFRYGMEEFQVRNMNKAENNSYVYDFDTSKLSILEFEYYLSAKMEDKIIYCPLNAPNEFFEVAGTSEEPLPEVPEEFPSPEQEEKRFKLPLSINGNIQTKIAQKEVISDEKKTNANGNLRIFHTYSKKDFAADFDSNFNYTNTTLEDEKSIDLSNMTLSVSKASHALKAGDINVNESEFSVYGLGRRGVEYIFNNQRAYFHLFDVSSQQPKGFEGFGVPKSDISIFGGVVGYNFLNKTISLKAIYLTGKDDPNQGVNTGSSQWFQRRKGDIIALVEESRFFSNKLNLKAEFARSSYDSDLEDDVDSVSDNALNIGGNISYGNIFVVNIGANYKYIGKEFNSIGYQYFTNNRKGYETNIGFTFKNINLTGAYGVGQDNVKNDPAEYTTENKNWTGNLSLRISEKVSLSLGYRRDKQDTYKDDVETFLQDSLSNEYSGNVSFNLSQSLSLNVSLTNSYLSSESYPDNDRAALTLNLGGSFREGEIISINPSFGYSRTLNKFTNEETSTYNSFLTTEISFIPKVFSINLTGSFNRTVMPLSNISKVLDIRGGFNIYLDRLIKIGSMVLSLNGNYQYSEMAGSSNYNYGVLFNCDFSF